MTIALPFIFLAFLGFAVASWVILFHLNRYSVPGDHTPLIRSLFIFGDVFFFVLTLVALLLAFKYS